MSLSEDVKENDLKLALGDDISNIQNYFTGKTVFVTGVTGSLGKLVVEKLLRSCRVERIYILVRAKKGKEPEERIKELFEIPAFQPLKKQMPKFSSKIFLCTGDCLEPKLGLSQSDLEVLVNEVHCIIHCAATVRLDETLRTATYINVRATWDLLKIAKEMKQLTSFVHVSTAYSHCPRSVIDEVFYEPPITAQKLLGLVEALKDDVLGAITLSVLKEWPNTYVFSKAIAEDVVKIEGNGLPMSIVRPSMIFSTCKEPIPGWIDNFYGFIGIGLGCGLGLLRSVYVYKQNTVDIIPLDYVVNTVLCAAWNGRKRTSGEQIECNSINNARYNSNTVYNCVSSVQNAVNYKFILDTSYNQILRISTVFMVLYPWFIVTNSFYLYLLYDFLFHCIPAYLVDAVLLCLGRKTIAVSGYKKYKKLAQLSVFFSKRNWIFRNANVQEMWNKLSTKDKEMFEFDTKLLDWLKFIEMSIVGGRLYLLKDPLDTVPRARRKQFWLRIVHYTLLTLFSFSLYLSLKFLFKTLV